MISQESGLKPDDHLFRAQTEFLGSVRVSKLDPIVVVRERSSSVIGRQRGERSWSAAG